MNRYKSIISTALIFLVLVSFGQELSWNQDGTFTKFDQLQPTTEVPLFSFILDGELVYSTEANSINGAWEFDSKIKVELFPIEFSPGWKASLVFTNLTQDTLRIQNVVFLSQDDSRPYITGFGDHWLSRSRLFRPGQSSVPVILPDNAWELGYSEVPLDHPSYKLAALARRVSWEKAQRRRFETDLFAQGRVKYEVYADTFEGAWQNGLKMFFQERYLYDLPDFDDTLYERTDLKWIRKNYVIHLMMAWDKWLFDREKSQYQLDKFIARGQKWYGGDDVIGLWPTWPSLGLDQRNQWDLFRDLPGGTAQIKKLGEQARVMGTRLFLCYNPWDESTRSEDQMDGLSKIIEETDADGVVLDTRGSSSTELQEAADKVKSGVVMYSEGMAIPKDMPGIVSGRVHNALYYPPLLNLNKLIRPDFAIFRVAELKYERIRREYNLSLFNGHGVEINMFSPGQPSWIEEDYRHLGRIAMILRENSSNFLVNEWVPLVESALDSIYINYWPSVRKDLYSIYSMKSEGSTKGLFSIKERPGVHYVDLWNHTELKPMMNSGKVVLSPHIGSFDKSYLGTNNEGAVGAVAVFKNHLEVQLSSSKNELRIKYSDEGYQIKLWAGDPRYDKNPYMPPLDEEFVNLFEQFGDYQGKFVIQLFDQEELIDERIVFIDPGIARRISKRIRTKTAPKTPKNMVQIPSGSFVHSGSHGDSFISYPEVDTTEQAIQGFYMDRYPVTNKDYNSFIKSSNYQPSDTTRYLEHWKNGKIPSGQENFPVVNVSFEDAKAYAKWARKRLPTELEWQYAAQAGDNRLWPWGDEPDTTKSNPGNGIAYAVGQFKKSANPWGVEDLTGQVWQMTQDEYNNGSYQFIMLKGGSYFRPLSSWWYVQGGPRPLNYRQMLLKVTQGFERNATVGFRCVKDLPKN